MTDLISLFPNKITHILNMMYNFKDIMIICGVDNVNLFDEFSPELSFSVDIFIGKSSSLMKKSFDKLDPKLKPTPP